MATIKNYSDFVNALLNAGFSVAGGGNDEGVFGLIPHGWNNTPADSSLRWHSGEPDTDPWEWRMRVLEERNDITYSKVFFRKAGYITVEWYPYFLAARRGNKTFEEAYSEGVISHFAKRIYDAVAEYEALPLHDIKRYAGISTADKTKFDSALTELQMKMYLTMCGRKKKFIQKAGGDAWASTVFCTVEKFFDEDIDVFSLAANITTDEALDRIKDQIYRLNPLAQEKKIEKFIKG